MRGAPSRWSYFSIISSIRDGSTASTACGTFAGMLRSGGGPVIYEAAFRYLPAGV